MRRRRRASNERRETTHRLCQLSIYPRMLCSNDYIDSKCECRYFAIIYWRKTKIPIEIKRQTIVLVSASQLYFHRFCCGVSMCRTYNLAIKFVRHLSTVCTSLTWSRAIRYWQRFFFFLFNFQRHGIIRGALFSLWKKIKLIASTHLLFIRFWQQMRIHAMSTEFKYLILIYLFFPIEFFAHEM